MTWCACRPIRSVIIRLFSKQIALPLRGRQICLFIGSLKVMLQETIRNTALQHCCDIVATLFRMVKTWVQHCYAVLG